MHCILVDYGSISGQIYSPPKSKIYYSSKVGNRLKKEMFRRSKITTGVLPFTYLGVPIFRGKPKAIHLSAIADEVIHKFTKWKGHTLSFAGRRCLINSVIASSLVHTMMVYKWPTTILKRVETAIRNYLWTGDTTKRGSFNVNWTRCCAPINEGGLGVRSIRLANSAFNCKLTWDIMADSILTPLRERYFKEDRSIRNFRRASSI